MNCEPFPATKTGSELKLLSGLAFNLPPVVENGSWTVRHLPSHRLDRIRRDLQNVAIRLNLNYWVNLEKSFLNMSADNKVRRLVHLLVYIVSRWLTLKLRHLSHLLVLESFWICLGQCVTFL